jgi:beta-lactamase superfamily II metal-dependent hydrolase
MTPLRALLASVIILLSAPWLSSQAPALLRVHFVDVGQGDGVLIQTPTGSIVYDAGENPERMRDYLTSIGASNVGAVIASHNHADHIGGLPAVLTTFRPFFYMDSGIPATTQTYARVIEAAAAAGSQLLDPTSRRVTMGDVAFTIVAPPGIPDWDQNDNSIGLVIEFGAFRASLAGDAEPREWAWWRTHNPEWLQPVHVHKASHHGSAHGDTVEGITALSPEVVVVGAGVGNAYGHPDPAALALYANAGAQVYRTDFHGTVVVEAQMTGAYSVRVERGEGAQPPPGQPLPVPTPTPTPTPTPSPPPTLSCIDINRAGLVELQEIIHIGPVRAQEIIDLRRSQPFRSVEDLIRVDGIGPARLADIKAQGRACVR